MWQKARLYEYIIHLGLLSFYSPLRKESTLGSCYSYNDKKWYQSVVQLNRGKLSLDQLNCNQMRLTKEKNVLCCNWTRFWCYYIVFLYKLLTNPEGAWGGGLKAWINKVNKEVAKVFSLRNRLNLRGREK